MRFLIFLFLPALWAETDFPQAPGVYPPEESGSTRIPTVPRNPYQLEDHGESDNFLFYYEKDPEATKSTVPPLTGGSFSLVSTETPQRVDPSELTEYAYFPSLTTNTKVNKETALLGNESEGTTIGVSTPHLASSLPIQEVSSYSMGITPLVPEDPSESAKASGPTPPPTSNGLHYNVASPSFPEIDLKKKVRKKMQMKAIEGNQLKYRVMQINESKGWSSTANIAKKTETLQNERNRAHFNLNPVNL
uniref:BZIP domain-containing protein n=1 Tax=Heterorhabditis bacteriophora TaxID=37862 RepID=A0A1I7XNG5_HETBA